MTRADPRPVATAVVSFVLTIAAIAAAVPPVA